MSDTIIFSSEFMKNQKHAEVMDPTSKFQALQTSENHALLFSIGSDGVFYLTRELVGTTTGWEKSDLSSALSQYHHGKKVTAKDFALSQNSANGKIDIGVVITVAGHDHLYLSLGNSASDTHWQKALVWDRIPYDATHKTPSPLTIANLFMVQSLKDKKEYIVADIIKEPKSSFQFVHRYYIDATKKLTGKHWNGCDLSADLSADTMQSCLGRKYRDRVDALYTLGKIGKTIELLYTQGNRI